MVYLLNFRARDRVVPARIHLLATHSYNRPDRSQKFLTTRSTQDQISGHMPCRTEECHLQASSDVLGHLRIRLCTVQHVGRFCIIACTAVAAVCVEIMACQRSDEGTSEN